MNIGVNARLLSDKPLEGMGRYTLETVYAMAKAHPESNFYLFFDHKIYQKYLLLPNMFGVLLWCPTKHPILILTWFEILLPFFLKKYKIDVFYSADNFTSLISSTPSVIICHDLAYKHMPEGISKTYLLFYRFFMPRYIIRAKSVGTVSTFVKGDIESFFNFSKKIFVAPNSLPTIGFNHSDNSTFAEIPGPYFIYVGSIHPRKNVLRMIEAFLKFNSQSQNKYFLVLLGRNAWGNDELKAYLKSEKIIHLKNISDNSKFKYISGSCGLLYVSLNEGFGIPILEGFACGVPVITSNVSSMPEIASVGALLVDPESVQEISTALQTIATDTNKCQELIIKGRKRLSNYSWDLAAKEIYKNLATE